MGSLQQTGLVTDSWQAKSAKSQFQCVGGHRKQWLWRCSPLAFLSLCFLCLSQLSQGLCASTSSHGCRNNDMKIECMCFLPSPCPLQGSIPLVPSWGDGWCQLLCPSLSLVSTGCRQIHLQHCTLQLSVAEIAAVRKWNQAVHLVKAKA